MFCVCLMSLNESVSLIIYLFVYMFGTWAHYYLVEWWRIGQLFLCVWWSVTMLDFYFCIKVKELVTCLASHLKSYRGSFYILNPKYWLNSHTQQVFISNVAVRKISQFALDIKTDWRLEEMGKNLCVQDSLCIIYDTPNISVLHRMFSCSCFQCHSFH